MRARALRRSLRAGPAGWADLMVMTVLAVRVERSIRRHPLPEVAARFGTRLQGTTSAAGRHPLDATEQRRRVIAEALLRRWPGLDVDAVCLRRALLLGWVLRARDPVLRVGVADQHGELTAHAWLEVQGATIGADATHQPFVFGGDA